MKRCSKCNYPNPDHMAACFKCGNALDAQPTLSAPEPTIMDQQATGHTCAECGSIPEPGDYAMPLCPNCRDRLAARPFPQWTMAATFVLLLVMIFAFAKFPAALNAGVAYERGLRAEGEGNYTVAETQYSITARQYPDSTPVLARLLIAQCKTMNLSGAFATYNTIEGREVSKELAAEVEAAMNEVDRKLPASKE